MHTDNPEEQSFVTQLSSSIIGYFWLLRNLRPFPLNDEKRKISIPCSYKTFKEHKFQMVKYAKILFCIFLHILLLQVYKSIFLLFQYFLATSDTNFVF